MTTVVELRFTFVGDPAGQSDGASPRAETPGVAPTNRLERGFEDAIRESTSTFLRDPAHDFALQGSYSMRTHMVMGASAIEQGAGERGTAFVVDVRAPSPGATALFEHVLVDALAELGVAYAGYQLRRDDPGERAPDQARRPATEWRHHDFFAWCADVVFFARGSDSVVWVQCKTSRLEYRAAYDLQPLSALLALFGDPADVTVPTGARTGVAGVRAVPANAGLAYDIIEADAGGNTGAWTAGPAVHGGAGEAAESDKGLPDWEAPLAAAAQAGDAESVVRAAGAIDWSDRSAHEFRRAVRWALAAGAHPVARALAGNGAARYPDDDELGRLAAVLAPPRIVATPPTVDAALRANHAWLRAHGSEYRGRWVALRAGTVVAADATRAAVRARVGAEPGVLVTKVA